jgi:hypothetical protein
VTKFTQKKFMSSTPGVKEIMLFSVLLPARWRRNIQLNDTQHNDTQHNDTWHNDIQHNNKKIVTPRIKTLKIMPLLLC